MGQNQDWGDGWVIGIRSWFSCEPGWHCVDVGSVLLCLYCVGEKMALWDYNFCVVIIIFHFCSYAFLSTDHCARKGFFLLPCLYVRGLALGIGMVELSFWWRGFSLEINEVKDELVV